MTPDPDSLLADPEAESELPPPLCGFCWRAMSFARDVGAWRCRHCGGIMGSASADERDSEYVSWLYGTR